MRYDDLFDPFDPVITAAVGTGGTGGMGGDGQGGGGMMGSSNVRFLPLKLRRLSSTPSFPSEPPGTGDTRKGRREAEGEETILITP